MLIKVYNYNKLANLELFFNNFTVNMCLGILKVKEQTFNYNIKYLLKYIKMLKKLIFIHHFTNNKNTNNSFVWTFVKVKRKFEKSVILFCGVHLNNRKVILCTKSYSKLFKCLIIV